MVRRVPRAWDRAKRRDSAQRMRASGERSAWWSWDVQEFGTRLIAGRQFATLSSERAGSAGAGRNFYKAKALAAPPRQPRCRLRRSSVQLHGALHWGHVHRKQRRDRNVGEATRRAWPSASLDWRVRRHSSAAMRPRSAVRILPCRY
jgi:hypothetical protein